MDFYLLKLNEFNECLPFAYQLINKAFQQGNDLKVLFAEEATQQMFDQLLWQQQADSFIPHHTLKINLENWLIIGRRQLTIHDTDIQIQVNLQLTQPKPLNCQRLLQLVPNNPQCLQLARIHYRFYRNLNYTMRTHHIN